MSKQAIATRPFLLHFLRFKLSPRHFKQTALKFHLARFILNEPYVPPANWDMTGSPVKCIVNRLETFKIALLLTTLHLPVDRSNSHEAEVTCRPACCLVFRLARSTGRVPLARFSEGCRVCKAVERRFALARRLHRPHARCL